MTDTDGHIAGYRPLPSVTPAPQWSAGIAFAASGQQSLPSISGAPETPTPVERSVPAARGEARAASSESATEPLHISHFPHQVAGHGILLKVANGRICKPAKTRELKFYNGLAEGRWSYLKPFVPAYYGWLQMDSRSVSKGLQEGPSALTAHVGAIPAAATAADNSQHVGASMTPVAATATSASTALSEEFLEGLNRLRFDHVHPAEEAGATSSLVRRPTSLSPGADRIENLSDAGVHGVHSLDHQFYRHVPDHDSARAATCSPGSGCEASSGHAVRRLAESASPVMSSRTSSFGPSVSPSISEDMCSSSQTAGETVHGHCSFAEKSGCGPRNIPRERSRGGFETTTAVFQQQSPASGAGSWNIPRSRSLSSYLSTKLGLVPERSSSNQAAAAASSAPRPAQQSRKTLLGPPAADIGSSPTVISVAVPPFEIDRTAADAALSGAEPTASSGSSSLSAAADPEGTMQPQQQLQPAAKRHARGSTADAAACTTWMENCFQRFIKQISSPEHEIQRYIVLEDLTNRFRRPCVLDLKIGTRQYGPDAPFSKQEKQRVKCEATTSATLGVRMCGLKKWRRDWESYENQDKYEGRKVSVERFRDAVETFFDDGVVLRVDAAAFFLVRLRKLMRVMQANKELKFFSSSILLIFEGDFDVQVEDVMKFVVFAKPDDDAAGTLQAGEGAATEAVAIRPAGYAGGAEYDDEDIRLSGADLAQLPAATEADLRALDRVPAELRMVDFANTYFNLEHGQADQGYIRGVRTMIAVLEDIICGNHRSSY